MLLPLLVLVLQMFNITATSSSDKSSSRVDLKCPMWLADCTNTTCGQISASNKAIKCTDTPKWSLAPCYCITEHGNNSALVTGLCPFTCSRHNILLLPVEQNISQITEELECGYWNRKGQLCGLCKEGHAPAVYSYSDKCINCTDYKWNWLKYIGIAYGPQTVFFIGIIFTKTSVTSGWMLGYVTVSQLMLTSVESRFRSVDSKKQNSIDRTLYPILYGVWNLDFFRAIYAPFCIHPKQSSLEVISMDYMVALYPLILLIATSILMELLSRYTAVKSCWLSVSAIQHSYNKHCSFKRTIIDAFVAVWILSYVKILNTSIQLLLYTPLVNLKGEVVSYVVFYNGSMTYFGRDHVPFAVLSISMTVLFNILPAVIITLYPLHCFQNLLNRRMPRKINTHTLHIVMDVFYRSYKIKTRAFAPFYLYIRILSSALLLDKLGPEYLAIVSSLYYCSAVAIGLVQPQERTLHNALNSLCFCLLGTIKNIEFLTYVEISVYPSHFKNHNFGLQSFLYLVLPAGFCLSVVVKLIPSKCTRYLSDVRNRVVARIMNKKVSNETSPLVDINV